MGGGTTEKRSVPAAGAVVSHARFVAAGVLASRLAGLARTKVISYLLGLSGPGDVVTAAFRVPNLLQNLLGDQAMSAAFIPIYSRLLAEGKREQAGRFAGAVFGLLLAAMGVLVLAGVLAAPVLVAVLNPGFLVDAARVTAGTQHFDRYPLAVTAARIVFPMAGLLVLAAWAQGVLNSHRRFFLPYIAPVLWNAAIIAMLVGAAFELGIVPATAGLDSLARLVLAGCIGALVGGLLQLAVQLPLVLRSMGPLRPTLSLRAPHVMASLRALGPALAGRGVVQLSFYLDQVLSSALYPGALIALQNGVLFYNLPFAVFATSVAASELPELAAGRSDPAALAERLRLGLRQVLFLVAPSTVGYLAFGSLVAGVLAGGRFGSAEQRLVYLVLAAYTLGMPASAPSRLLQNAFFALQDTASPARIAAVRVAVAALIGGGLMLGFDRVPVAALGVAAQPGDPIFLGAVGLALGSAIGAWVELLLLDRRLSARLGVSIAPWRLAAPMLANAIITALPAAAVWWLLRERVWLLQVIAVPGLFAGLYLALAHRRQSPELRRWLGRGG